MLHDESRELLLKAWDKTHDAKKVAEFFSVNTSTVYRMVNRRDRTGEWRTRIHLRGRKPTLSQEQKQAIIQLVQDQPNITINEMIEQLHLTVSDETVRRAFIKAGYTYKKKSLHAKEQEPPRCQEKKEMLERRYCWISG